MPALFITEDDVKQLVDMPASIEALDEAFRQMAHGRARNVPRSRARAPGIILHTMSASAEYAGLVGWKAYTSTRKGLQFHVAVYDIEIGKMHALIEADHLGRLRTGAATGVAAKYMARRDAHTAGLFGTGRQARTQLEAICAVRPVQRAFVYSRAEDKRVAFAEDMAARCEIDVVAAASPEEVLAESEIVITATTSKTPVFDGRQLREGMFVAAVGANFPEKAEIDATTVERAGLIVCDHIEQCRGEAGDFTEALERGLTDWSRMRELADVAAGKQPGRTRDDEITLFKSVGLGLEDVAMAGLILERARERGMGRPLPF